MRNQSETSKRQRTSATLVGLGVIGSYTASFLGRIAEVGEVTLIDQDTYEDRNLRSQDIVPEAVNKPKATAQAGRLRRINRELQVTAIADAVERVPLGRLRGALILGAVDSRETRRYLSEAAWHLGIPYIDAGVAPDGLLARIDTFVPSAEGPCMQCAWDDRDYAALEQRYPCDGATAGHAPTNSPAPLGALAASLQVLEAEKLLAGRLEQVAVGQQVLIDAAHHQHYVTRYRRNGCCRFDHEIWALQSVRARPEDLTIGQAFAQGGESPVGTVLPVLRVAGRSFVTRVACPSCGHARKTLRLQGRLGESERICVRCGREMTPVGFEMLEQLDARSLPKKLWGRSLRSLGFEPCDIYSIITAPERARHYVLEDS